MPPAGCSVDGRQSDMIRLDGRNYDQLRRVTITKGFNKYAEGSALIEFGDTKIHCTATVEEHVPMHKKGSGSGWVTAEYSLLPRSTAQRNSRDIAKLKLAGRTAEIQRLIGRSLRTVIDMEALGERSVIVDCDVIQADGGTRTASITGGFVALAEALTKLHKNGTLARNPIKNMVAAVSVGMIRNDLLLDLCYAEDSAASVDMNVVMTDRNEFIELQGTGEQSSFSKRQLDGMLSLAQNGIFELIELQKKVLE